MINCLFMEEKKKGLKNLKNPKAFIDYCQKLMMSMKI